MKIRAIYLKNVRRFAGRKAELTDIGDGVSTITEPNETGKSTFFDALHAVLFYDHKTTAAEIRSLQPYSKGAVEIAADIELDSGRFRVAKTFLASRSATITNLDTNQIIAQEGEAEAWIEKSLGTDIAGPAGLLWVKQGNARNAPDPYVDRCRSYR
jgi:DNA repair exonuclease SbcCD ATPase subunit